MTIDSILFKDVTIIDGEGPLRKGDVWIEDGKIKAVEPQLSVSAEMVIKEPHLAIMPGGIDPHVHFREPGATHKEDLASGSRAAAKGGITSFFEMPNTDPPAESIATIADKKRRAAESSCVHYNFFVAASNTNIEELMAIENVAGIKIFMGSSTGNLLVDDPNMLAEIFDKTRHTIAIHSEDEDIIRNNRDQIPPDSVHAHYAIRSVEAAVKCTQRAIGLALKYQRRLHICHLTTAEECELIRIVRQTAPYITTEVSPQHLLLAAPDIYDQIDCLAQINPPIREQRHADALWRGLQNGVVQFVATDHAPHTLEEKCLPFGQAPSGMPGVETSIPLMLNLAAQQKCTYNDVVQWCSTQPAHHYKIRGKGHLKPGYDGDVTLLDLEKKQTLRHTDMISKSGWTAFDGHHVQGAVVMTCVKGQIVYREGSFDDDIRGEELVIE